MADFEPQLAALRQQAEQQLADPRLLKVLNSHWISLSAATQSTPDLSSDIHPECQMLSHSLRHHRDAARSISQYFAVALQQYQTVGQILQRLLVGRKAPHLLDFACGYGRLLRFLVPSLGAERVWAAEIQPDAVQYVADRYGVVAVQSTIRPEDFQLDQRFEMIWVASLFSHLPDGLFQRWLARLGRLLVPGGLLCFSVHDEALLPTGRAGPKSGLFYIAGSENQELDPEYYGTTFVSERYVRSAVEAVLGTDWGCWRSPRLLAHEQDVYVCCDAHGPDLSAMGGIRRGPRGWLDERNRVGNELQLKGWAGSLDDGAIEALEIDWAGQTIRLLPDEPTPEVARVLGDKRLDRCGWSSRLAWPDDDLSPYLTISAVSRLGERALIFAGSLDEQAG